MKGVTVATGGALLAAGVAIGLFLAPRAAEPPTERAPDAYVPRERLADEGEKASLASLRARIRDLERQLADAAAACVAATNAPGRGDFPGAGPGDRRESFPARLARLKEEDPARYAQITNNMARFRRRRAEQQLARLEFLSSVDTAKMDRAARDTHDSLQKYLTQREEIERQLQEENLAEDRRHELHEQMREIDRQIRKLNSTERENLISATARTLGFEGQDVSDITATMQEIIQATDNGFGGPGGPGPGHGGEPPPPPSS